MSAFAAQRRTTVLVVAGAVVAWALTVERMRGMDAGPGTDLGGLGWYLGIWVTMTAAMMLPSTVPAARTATEAFVAGYLAVWTVYGLVAYGLYRVLSSVDLGWLAWNHRGPWAAGGAIVAAGAYELTPLKRRGLRRCRKAGDSASPLRSGLAHGVHCVACSGGLMAVLFVLGVMSLFWMALVAAAIFAEKVLPHGTRLVAPIAGSLVALGVWVGAAPASVPGLTQPDGDAPSMEMGLRSSGQGSSAAKRGFSRIESRSSSVATSSLMRSLI